jgi:hypothetical protein
MEEMVVAIQRAWKVLAINLAIVLNARHPIME